MKFGKQHYVPLLKGKRGEYRALKNLKSRADLTPMLEVPPVETDVETGKPKKSAEQHVALVVKNIHDSWGTDPIFLDLNYVEDGTFDAVTHVFSEAREHNLQLIPVINQAVTGLQLAAIKTAMESDDNGCCFRIQIDGPDDLLEVNNHIASMLRDMEIKAVDVHLIIDLGYFPADTKKFMSFALRATMNSIRSLKSFCSFTVAGAAIPGSIPISSRTSGTIPRAHWMLWKEISKSAKRKPTFGDFGVTNPDYVVFDARTMSAAARVIYTIEDAWGVIKGRSLKLTGYDQYRELSKALIAKPCYKGRDFSWGDAYIEDCANGDVSTGNPEMWLSVATSHHMQFVQEELAVLPPKTAST